MVTSFTGLFDALSGSTLGYILIAIGLFFTILSRHRYLLIYFLGGMVYWAIVEMVQSTVIKYVNLSIWHSYVLALIATWFIPSILLIYHYFRTPSTPFHSEKYIEHTPIYNNYKPRFHN